MRLHTLYPGSYACNSYLLTAGKNAVLFDCSAPVEEVRKALLSDGAALDAIVLTHGHFDHLLTLAEMKEAFPAPVFLRKGDAAFPWDPEKNCALSFLGRECRYPEPDRLLSGGETLSFGGILLKVLHTPGHTPGSCVFLCGDLAFTGDTLFDGSHGRTDLPGGDFHAMRQSLSVLAGLPDAVTVYPGHGQSAPLREALLPLSRILKRTI